ADSILMRYPSKVFVYAVCPPRAPSSSGRSAPPKTNSSASDPCWGWSTPSRTPIMSEPAFGGQVRSTNLPTITRRSAGAFVRRVQGDQVIDIMTDGGPYLGRRHQDFERKRNRDRYPSAQIVTSTIR